MGAAVDGAATPPPRARARRDVCAVQSNSNHNTYPASPLPSPAHPPQPTAAHRSAPRQAGRQGLQVFQVFQTVSRGLGVQRPNAASLPRPARPPRRTAPDRQGFWVLGVQGFTVQRSLFPASPARPPLRTACSPTPWASRRQAAEGTRPAAPPVRARGGCEHRAAGGRAGGRNGMGRHTYRHRQPHDSHDGHDMHATGAPPCTHAHTRPALVSCSTKAACTTATHACTHACNRRARMHAAGAHNVRTCTPAATCLGALLHEAPVALLLKLHHGRALRRVGAAGLGAHRRDERVGKRQVGVHLRAGLRV